MFGRRVASGYGIPKVMYARLGIHSSKQANRRVPALVPVSGMISRSVSGGLNELLAASYGEKIAIGGDLAKTINPLACLGLLPSTLANSVYANQFLIKLLMDMTCTYRFMISHLIGG
ncbi:unnamed protein product [Phytomonas sp. EM1]|nr:unnamed protein product [Phytomonas sp. EM1]|eukprot:CCW64737.1 unnamed protein product [Phytomonas sp. isolate EM1]